MPTMQRRVVEKAELIFIEINQLENTIFGMVKPHRHVTLYKKDNKCKEELISHLQTSKSILICLS